MLTLDEAIALTNDEKNSEEALVDLAHKTKPLVEDVMKSEAAKNLIAQLERIYLFELILAPEVLMLRAFAYGVIIGVLMEKDSSWTS